MLEINSLKVSYGPIEALHGIDVTVSKGRCVALLGPNGAGKTSTLSGITGTASATGSIRLDGDQIADMSTEDRCRLGLTISPEGRRVFANLSVRDNLIMGGSSYMSKAQLNVEIEEWFVQFPALGERCDQLVGSLSGGVNSRCLRSAAPCCHTRASCCFMNHLWGLHKKLSPRSSILFENLKLKEPRSYWWNKMRQPLSVFLTMSTF